MKRVLLVGFMASGKTRVGRALADLLGWSFHDFDSTIEAESGLTIPEIFRTHGEDYFRSLETEVGSRLLAMEAVVLASGGGWPARPGAMKDLPAGTFSVWLQVDPEAALERARRDGPTRPLLDCQDPEERVRSLLQEREPFYRKAHLAIDSSSAGPDILAQRIRDSFFDGGSKTTPPSHK